MVNRNGSDRFLAIDAQGHRYARYVGFNPIKVLAPKFDKQDVPETGKRRMPQPA